MPHEIMWFLLCWIFFLLFFSKGILLFFCWHKTGVYTCISYTERKRERERERERLAWLFYCMIWVILPVTFSLWSTFLGMFIVVVVSTTQLKCSYNTSLLEETCNESQSRKWKVVNNEGFCVYRVHKSMPQKKFVVSFLWGQKRRRESKWGYLIFLSLCLYTKVQYVFNCRYGFCNFAV